MSKQATIPPSNGFAVTTRDFNFRSMVVGAWGPEWAAPDHGVYEWSNGRRFDSSDMYRSGIYAPNQGGTSTGTSPPPPPSGGLVLSETGDSLILENGSGNILTENGQ